MSRVLHRSDVSGRADACRKSACHRPDKAQRTGDDKCHLPAGITIAHTTSGGAIIAPIEEPR